MWAPIQSGTPVSAQNVVPNNIRSVNTGSTQARANEEQECPSKKSDCFHSTDNFSRMEKQKTGQKEGIFIFNKFPIIAAQSFDICVCLQDTDETLLSCYETQFKRFQVEFICNSAGCLNCKNPPTIRISQRHQEVVIGNGLAHPKRQVTYICTSN
ncbi:MAG: hypothetical protein JWQ71_2586 [Pedosphaera sp.]|nr:hypothetical protein [Pedosphaera sp.]